MTSKQHPRYRHRPTGGPQVVCAAEDRGERDDVRGEADAAAELEAHLAEQNQVMADLALTLLHRTDDRVIDGLEASLWLQQHGRMLPKQAQRLLTTVDTLKTMPALCGALEDGRLSWGQVDTICAAARKLRNKALRAQLDAAIGQVADDLTRALPSELTDRVWDWVAELNPTDNEREETETTRRQAAQLIPTLFGGRLEADLDTESFATVTEAIDGPLGPPCTDDIDEDIANEADRHDLDNRTVLGMAQDRRRATQLVNICRNSLGSPGGSNSHDGHDDATDAGRTRTPRPSVTVVATLDSLLDQASTPASVLTTLTGGRLRATSTLTRSLLDERGADLRGVIIDDTGDIIGVGRKTRMPPDWLRDAIIARDLTDRAPGSRTAARRCDLDHIIPWDDGGATDVDNLQTIGRRRHTQKTDGHWTCTPQADGTITWRHTSGTTIDQPPTWKHRQPFGSDPPDPPG